MTEDPTPPSPPQAVPEQAAQALGGLSQALGAVLASQQGSFVVLAEARRVLGDVRCPRTQKPPELSLDFERDAEGEATSRVIVKVHSKIHRAKIAEASRAAGLDVQIRDAEPKKKKKAVKKKRTLGKRR